MSRHEVDGRVGEYVRRVFAFPMERLDAVVKIMSISVVVAIVIHVPGRMPDEFIKAPLRGA